MPTEDNIVEPMLNVVAKHVTKGGDNTTREPGIDNALKILVNSYLKEEKNQKIQNFRCNWLKGEPKLQLGPKLSPKTDTFLFVSSICTSSEV